MITMLRITILTTLPILMLGTSAAAQEVTRVPVETFELSNGMKFLAVSRPELTTVSAGWVAHVGSSNEHPGITGISHFFEHMMFKGSRTIGTRNIDRDLEIIEEQEELQERIRAVYRDQRERHRLGAIVDPFADSERPPELIELEARFDALVGEQRELIVKDEFDKVLHRGRRVGNERLHERGRHRLFHHGAREQARALVLDGVGPTPEPRLS